MLKVHMLKVVYQMYLILPTKPEICIFKSGWPTVEGIRIVLKQQQIEPVHALYNSKVS